jgi:hypothetical protein
MLVANFQQREKAQKATARQRLVNTFKRDHVGCNVCPDARTVLKSIAAWIEDYRKKLWTNHERISAQARAFTESREYILPAFFDENAEVPGLLKTTGHIVLADHSPAALAELITQKLREAGVRLKQAFSYADEAKADVDFPLKNGNEIADLVKAMKTYNWYQQNPAIEAVLKGDWSQVSANESQSISMRLWKRESRGRIFGQAASGVGFHSNQAGARHVERNVLRSLLQCRRRVPLRQDQGTMFGEVTGDPNCEEVRALITIHPTDTWTVS